MMKYDKLEARLLFREVIAAPKHKKRLPYSNELLIALYANSRPIADNRYWYAYLGGLQASIAGPGQYQIICCGCGYAFCDALGDYRTTVLNDGHTITWLANNGLSMRQYCFEIKQYEDAIGTLAMELNDYFTTHRKRIDANKIVVWPDELWIDWNNNQVELMSF